MWAGAPHPQSQVFALVSCAQWVTVWAPWFSDVQDTEWDVCRSLCECEAWPQTVPLLGPEIHSGWWAEDRWATEPM